MKSSKRARESDEMPFLDHLEELRWRILWSLAALVVGTIVGFYLVAHFNALSLLIAPVKPYLNGGKLKYLNPADPFIVTLKLAVTAGVLMAFPIVIYEFWSFLSPALLPREKRAILPALYLGLVLFISGMALAYFGVLPIALKFFTSFQQTSLEQNITVDGYLSLVIKLLLGFGVVFETPVIMLVLGALGIVKAEQLRRTRRYAIVIIFVLAALLTPPDVFSQLLMAVPLLVLYESSVWLVTWTERGRRRREAAEEEEEEETEAEPGAQPEAQAEAQAQAQAEAQAGADTQTQVQDAGSGAVDVDGAAGDADDDANPGTTEPPERKS